MILDGKKIQKEIIEELKKEREKFGKLRLIAFLIGEDKEKEDFLKVKEKIAKELNIDFRIYKIPETFSRKKLRKYISQIVRSDLVNGAIIQLPLPEKFKTQYFLNAIPPEKDVDCLSSRNLGKFFTDSWIIRPPVVEVVDYIKNKFNLDFENKIICLVGYGRLTGKPLVHYFCSQKSTVIVIRKNTENKEKFFKIADVVVSGAGKKNLVNECKKGAILIDFGYSFEKGKIYGDINFEKLKTKAKIITPTPGGTGPILTAMIFKNLLKLDSLQKRWTQRESNPRLSHAKGTLYH